MEKSEANLNTQLYIFVWNLDFTIPTEMGETSYWSLPKFEQIKKKAFSLCRLSLDFTSMEDGLTIKLIIKLPMRTMNKIHTIYDCVNTLLIIWSILRQDQPLLKQSLAHPIYRKDIYLELLKFLVGWLHY